MKLSLLALFTLVLSFGVQAQKKEVVEQIVEVKEEVVLEQVGPIKAKLMVRNGALMVDVREVNEVAGLAYDVENIINIPLSQLKERMNEIPKDKELVIACRSGNRSRRAMAMLTENGYTNMFNLAGGIKGWSAKGLETVTGGEKTAKKACCAKPNSKDCNPDGTCKKGAKKAKKACCAKPNSKDCKPDGTCKKDAKKKGKKACCAGGAKKACGSKEKSKN